MASKIIILALGLCGALCEANNYLGYGRGYLERDYSTENAAVDDRSAYDKNRNTDYEYGTSDGKKVSFSNNQKSDESGLTNEETLKRGPTIINDPYYKGYGGGRSYYQGGVDYSKKAADIRKRTDGSTAYDASDIKAERNARKAADISRGNRDLKGVSSKNRQREVYNPYYRY